MLRKMRRAIQTGSFMFLIVSAFLLSGSGTGMAMDDEDEREEPSWVKALVTIEEKTRGYLLANGKMLTISESTRYFDLRGYEITIEELSVPCRADIYFVPGRSGIPHALKIITRSLLRGATASLPEPLPE